jgi:parallel beta-helix repeat protein
MKTTSLPAPKRRSVSIIEALEERIAPATFVVTNLNDSGAGSLRSAISLANGNGNPAVVDVIEFNLGGLGPHTIELQSALPMITQGVTLDGTANPDYVDRPTVEIDGNGTGNVFNVGSTGVTIRGLVINGGTNGIVVNSPGQVTVKGCFIGTDYTGTVAKSNSAAGISLNTAGNIIGGTTAADRNVIAGNGTLGIVIAGASSIANVVQGNYIGTNLLASLQIPNGAEGIAISGGGTNFIGGSAAGAGNVISGNQGHDIYLFNSSNNSIAGNIIGLDLSMQHELQSKKNGIVIDGTSAGNIIGGFMAGSGNIIAGHDEIGGMGIQLLATGSGNQIASNIIGTNPSGADELGNGIGVFVKSPGTIIGDLSGHGNFIAGNNVTGISAVSATDVQVLGNKVGIVPGANENILANGSHGIYIDTSANAVIKGNTVGGNGADGLQFRSSANGVIQGNFLGTNSIGTLARANAFSGLAVVFDCPNLLVGGSQPGQGNVISGNSTAGLYIYSLNAPITVQGNMIGTNLNGAVPLPNGVNGIHIQGGSHLIGGTQAGQGNVISGNGRGIFVESAGNTIQGNIIGLNKAMTAKLSNQGNAGGYGIWIQNGGNNLIGGEVAGARNVIAGNAGSGIYISSDDSGNMVKGNLVGTNAAGALSLGNAGHGVLVSAPNTIIGGDTAAERNVVSGNGIRGVTFSNALNPIVQGNWIGLSPNGTSAVPNQAGVSIGETTANALILDNVISGNTQWGIVANGNSGHTILGNKIGTNAAGTAAVPNQDLGIYAINLSNVTIGGAGVGEVNVISGNGNDAVLLLGGTSVTVSGNLIGTNAAGTGAIANGQGVSISSLQLPVNDVSVTGNVLAGNTGTGLNVVGKTGGLNIQSNWIGVLKDGTALGNATGISITNATDTLIGGTPAQANTIAFNTGDGIAIFGAGSAGIAMLGNDVRQNGGVGLHLVGTTQTITASQGNHFTQNGAGGVVLEGAGAAIIQGNEITGNQVAGVRVLGASEDNLIGGTSAGQGNVISGHAGPGVVVLAGEGASILGNSIFGNTGLAIDLGGDGATPNDANDLDAGGNGQQNAPALIGATIFNGSTVVAGSLDSVPNTNYRLEFYSGANGQPQHFIGAMVVKSSNDGEATFQFDLGATLAGEAISATATNLTTGDTSEVAIASFVPAVTISDATITETDDGTASAVFTVTLSSVPAAPVSIDFATQFGTADAGDFTATSGTLTFAGSTLTQSIVVPLTGDDIAEAAEKFNAQLSHALNAVIIDGTGEGTILNDDTTLVISPNGKTATWRDIDGDLVTLKSSKAVLSPDDFLFLADGNGGQQLALLDLSDDPGAAKATIKLSAKRDPLVPQGNGRVNVGFLNAAGVDLASVSISGDLGRIEAGDANSKTPALKTLTVGSLGFFGLTTQSPGGSLASELKGNLGSLIVRGDLNGAALHVTGNAGKISVAGNINGNADAFSGSIQVGGKLGSLRVGGSLDAGAGASSGLIESGAAMGAIKILGAMSGGAHLASGGSLGAVSIGGDLAGESGDRATISAQGNIKSLRVAGEVREADVLAGFDSALTAVNPDAVIGAVKVSGNWIASNLAAGVSAGADGKFASGDEAAASPSSKFTDLPKLVSRIASIQVGGYIAGTDASDTDHFAFTAQRIGKLSAGAVTYNLNPTQLDSFQLGKTADTFAAEVA